MDNYPKLILDLEAALSAERKLSMATAERNGDLEQRLAELEDSLNLSRQISEQRNRTIGELGEQLETQRQLNFRIVDGYERRLATITAERNALKTACEKIMRIPSMPFPDRGAHSEQTFSRAVFTAWSRMRAEAGIALASLASNIDNTDLGSLNLQDDHTDPKSAYADAVGISRTKEL